VIVAATKAIKSTTAIFILDAKYHTKYLGCPSLRGKRFHRLFRPSEVSLFGGAKIGASALFCARPKPVRAFKKQKRLQPCGKPYGNACHAGYGCPSSLLDGALPI